MLQLLIVPFVLWMELLDILMTFIPKPVWGWLWQDAVLTGSNEIAAATDVFVRVVLSLLLLIPMLVWWFL